MGVIACLYLEMKDWLIGLSSGIGKELGMIWNKWFFPSILNLAMNSDLWIAFPTKISCSCSANGLSVAPSFITLILGLVIILRLFW